MKNIRRKKQGKGVFNPTCKPVNKYKNNLTVEKKMQITYKLCDRPKIQFHKQHNYRSNPFA